MSGCERSKVTCSPTELSISAAQLALAGHDEPKVCLDTIISAMKDTAKNMHENYKETSMGGIAVSLGMTLEGAQLG